MPMPELKTAIQIVVHRRKGVVLEYHSEHGHFERLGFWDREIAEKFHQALGEAIGKAWPKK